MHDAVRRFSVLFLVFGLALISAFFLRGREGRYGLFDLLRGEVAKPAGTLTSGRFTPATKAAISPGEVPLLVQMSEETSKLAEAVSPSVVSIDTSKRVLIHRRTSDPTRDFHYDYTEAAQQPGLGSGVLISAEGHIMTNHHVVDGVDDITVTLHNREQFKAVKLGSDKLADIALLQIQTDEVRSFPALRFAGSSSIRQGQLVFVVGNPLGLQGTITDGIISSASLLRVTDTAPALLQTSATINPGNSGSPLVDVQGDIVGIIGAVYRGPSDGTALQGYGLAIPAATAQAAMQGILENEQPVRGFLGVFLEDITPITVLTMGLKNSDGALIRRTAPGSPAEEAGLRPDDIIVTYGTSRIRNGTELIKAIDETPVGTTVPVKVLRGGELLSLSVSIREQGSVPGPEADPEMAERARGRSGLEVRDLSGSEKLRLGFERFRPALLVVEVDEASPADLAGLRPGYYIHEVNGEAVHSRAEFCEWMTGETHNFRLTVTTVENERRILPMNLP